MSNVEIVNFIEIAVMRCRSRAATLDEDLLLYLIDMVLLHLRRESRSEKKSTTGPVAETSEAPVS